MTDEEFNRYCAEVMGYTTRAELSYIVVGHAKYHPVNDLNQMAEVFDKLWLASIGWSNERMHRTQSNFRLSKGISQAMREFIESTKEQE